MRNVTMALLAALALAPLTAACERDGEGIDEQQVEATTQETGQQLENAAETAADATGEAAQTAGDALENAGQELEQEAGEAARPDTVRR